MGGAWDDLADVQKELDAALEEFDWLAVARLCKDLAHRVQRSPEVFPVTIAARLLSSLRRHRRFEEVGHLSEQLLQSRCDDSEVIIRPYAQALIDSGSLRSAKALLLELVDRGDRSEVYGLLGRLHKQLYVNAAMTGGPPRTEALRDSARYYGKGCTESPDALWHRINLVAVLARARADGVELADILSVDERELARVVEDDAWKSEDDWALPVRLEVCVALGNWEKALAAANEYVAEPRFRAFELASTLRQLEEVWRLPGDSEPACMILALLRSALVRRSGGVVVLDRKATGAALQANFDREGRLPLGWWKLALQRCEGIAQIETEAGRRMGSGFLVEPSAFFEDHARINGPVLLTNMHVISKDARITDSIAPEDARACFEASGRTVKVGEIIASNESLDACFVTLEPIDARRCPLQAPPVAFEPGKRVYVIGYPRGGHLSFSIHDSSWLGMNDTHFHYRTPTEPGSSGSPVFEEKEWKVVALHQAGGEKVKRLSGNGTYQANVGISLAAIREAVRTQRIG